jgi:diguanylate cyclase (GGDEF)-like protein
VFGSRTHAPRPVLLGIVFGAFLAIIGITATAQSVLVGAHFSTATINDVVGSDAATVRAFVNAFVTPGVLDPAGGASPAEIAGLETRLASLLGPGEIVRVELRRPDGTIVAADTAGLRGTTIPVTGDFQAATQGRTQAGIGPAEGSGAGPGVLPTDTVLHAFLPLLIDGEVKAVVGIWRDGVPILARLEDVRRAVVLVTLSAALVTAALLYLVFRSAQARLSRQTASLMEAARRDPLTGLLNHGAIVGSLALEIESARAAGRPLGVALFDIDNFRPLNDTHGHDAGDLALIAVGELLEQRLGPGLELGRYGPDEFLVIAGPAAVATLDPLVDAVRTGLVDLSLRFEETERLPVTVSVGIATYPAHAESVTSLLATVVQALGEAKAGGGDGVRYPVAESVEDPGATGYDVLQGLVIAIDTKDRYTKAHSEDVARYATFLAGRIGLEPEEIRTIGVAGMLHDVGKIGIPDHILRKPGRLTEAEQHIVQQHVLLGDMIVRDLPDIERVRAGIRHHHERWDGGGYLTGLDGESIPLIARILAVADAFSAMTTNRPYRKALGVGEALVRLGDAAGSQLDARLVTAFIDGIEGSDAPPLPGQAAPTTLWRPGRRVA